MIRSNRQLNELRTKTNNKPLPNNHIDSVLLSFIPTLTIFLLNSIINYIIDAYQTQIGAFIYTAVIFGLFISNNFISFMALSSLVNFGVYWRSAFLSNIFLLGYMLTTQVTFGGMVAFGYYLMCLSFFHLSEYVFTALFNQRDVSTDSFLLNHSWEYGVAALTSWTEFFIELWLVPSLKLNLYTRFAGLFLALFGETFRKLAMYTAGTNFNHYIQESKQSEHVLVKRGVYSLVRHPSYFGWFYWSIGTQILLANPICTLLYSIVTWRFFRTRITYEEFYLLKFFRKEYVEYQKKTASGIPFVKGYVNYNDDDSLD